MSLLARAVMAPDPVPLAEAVERSGLPLAEIYRRLRAGTLPAVLTRAGYQIPRGPFERWVFAYRRGTMRGTMALRQPGEQTVAEVSGQLKQSYRAVLRHLKAGRFQSRWDGWRHWIRLENAK